jgi:hypothetical protein
VHKRHDTTGTRSTGGFPRILHRAVSFSGQVHRNGTRAGYQSQQAGALEILVASRVELNFKVRPLSDVWEAGQYRSWQMPQSKQSVGFYGPDVDTSRIAVFDPNLGLTGLSSLQ